MNPLVEKARKAGANVDFVFHGKGMTTEEEARTKLLEFAQEIGLDVTDEHLILHRPEEPDNPTRWYTIKTEDFSVELTAFFYDYTVQQIVN